MNPEQKTIMIISAPCWQCNANMFVALAGNDTGGMDYGPESFSQEEIETAQKEGVILKKIHSKTMGEDYLASTCGKCGAFIGQWFYYASYYTEALYGRLEYKRVVVEDKNHTV